MMMQSFEADTKTYKSNTDIFSSLSTYSFEGTYRHDQQGMESES